MHRGEAGRMGMCQRLSSTVACPRVSMCFFLAVPLSLSLLSFSAMTRRSLTSMLNSACDFLKQMMVAVLAFICLNVEWS